LEIAAVNDPPSFIPGANPIEVGKDQYSATAYDETWATEISCGPLEDDPGLTFVLDPAPDPLLFSEGPTIDAAPGHLSFKTVTGATGTQDFTVWLDDQQTENNTSEPPESLTITITDNTAPTAVDDAYTTPGQTLLSVTAPGVLANDTDPDEDPLTASIVTNPGHAATNGFTFSADGSFSYTPATGFFGADSFTYQANDGHGGTDTATVSITVTAPNDPPQAVQDAYTTAEDTLLTVTAPGVLANDTDPEEDPLTVSLVTGPAHAAANGFTLQANGSFSYQPAANFFGTDSFTYAVNDGHGGADTTVVSLTVTAVNDPPVATANSYTTTEETLLSITAPGVLANDSDVEGDTFTAQLVTGPAHAAANGFTLQANGSFSYSPVADFFGTDSFTYQAVDSHTAVSSSATVNIMVTGVNDPPVALDGSITVLEDTPGSGTLHATDIEGDPLTYGIVYQGLKGMATITNAATGAYSYTPNADENGLDLFTFIANDGTNTSNIATIIVTITPVSDPPVAQDDHYSTLEDIKLAVEASGVLSNDFDADRDTMTASLLTGPSHAASGGFTLNADGSFTYTPAVNSFGTDQFTYQVSDGNGGTDTATVFITITAVNDEPVAQNDYYSTPEETRLTVIAPGVLANDTDVENDTLTAALITGPSHAVMNGFQFYPDGSFSYTPAANFFGTDTFLYQVSDGNGTDMAIVSITVTSSNDTPVAQHGTLAVIEDTPASGMLSATDPEEDPLTFSIIQQGTKGSVAITNASTGAYTYTPADDATGMDVFTFKANDGNADSNVASVTVTISPVDDSPIAPNGTLIVIQNTPCDSVLPASDVDSTQLTYSIVNQGTRGTVVITNASTGEYTYTPETDQLGEDAFTFKVNDGTSDSNTGTIDVSIITGDNTSGDDPPIAYNGTLPITEDTPTNGTLIATDVDSTVLTYSIVSQGTAGTVTITNTATGAYTYTPADNAFGTDTFTFKVNDGTWDSNDASIRVSIGMVNDAPVAYDDSVSTLEDTMVSGKLYAGDEGQQLAYRIVGQGALGTATITNATLGTFTYTPGDNANGIDTFTFIVNDGTSDSNEATITVTITAVNDQPTFTMIGDTQAPINGGQQIVPTFITGYDLGPDDEDAAQLVDAYVVTNNNHALFTAQPVIGLDGTLTYTPAADFIGEAVVTVRLRDNGGTEHGGINLSEPQTFTINAMKVKEIQYQKPDETYDPVPDPLYVPVGVDITFIAIPNPTTAAWPLDQPVWRKGGVVVGTGGTLTTSFATTGPSTLSAEYGNLVVANIVVVSAGFAPSPLVINDGEDDELTVAIDPVIAESVVTFDTEEHSIATVAGAIPTLTVSGVETGRTDVIAKLPAGWVCGRDTAFVVAPLSIMITYPEDGSTYTAPVNLDLTAEVTRCTGMVSTVEFYDGETLLGTASPVDDTVITLSDGGTGTVAADGTFTLTDDRTGVISNNWTTITVSDDGTGIVQLDGHIILTDGRTGDVTPDDTFHWLWADIPLGIHVLTARVTDTTTAVAVSPPVAFNVTEVGVSTDRISDTEGGAADGDGWGVAISGNGRYVVFSSEATNLGSTDTNALPDVYLVDSETGNIERISVGVDNAEPDGDSWDAAINADGTCVAFASNAANLASDGNGQLDIFVRNRTSSSTELVSVATGGGQANGPSWGPSLSSNGNLVAFISDANNLVAGDSDNTPDIYLRNRQSGTTERVVALGSTSQNGGGTALSADGRYVAFWTESSLVTGDTNGAQDVYVFDRQTQTVERVSVAGDGTQGDAASWAASISDDGRYVAFTSDATNLVANDTNDFSDVFVHDRQTGTTIRASATQGDADSWEAVISGNGAYVLFTSNATNLTADTNASCDVFVCSLGSGALQRASRSSTGQQANADSWDTDVSDGGLSLAYVSLAKNLIASDTSDGKQVFLATVSAP